MKNTQTTTTTTPEILKTSIELLTDYKNWINETKKTNILNNNQDLNKWLDILTDNVNQNIKHLNLMRISEKYRLKQ